MLSLYIHTPFCNQKCAYCSFSSFPVDQLKDQEKMLDDYTKAILDELKDYQKKLGKQEIKTIYFGGGTPSKLGFERLKLIMDHIESLYNTEDTAELTIELNPYPEEETIQFVKKRIKTYRKYPRVRISFGLQTFDNQILSQTGRPSSFAGIVDFLRALRPLKQENVTFNFDFIAFGKFTKDKQGNKVLRDEVKRDFFQKFVTSKFADSFSVYTLELFQGAKRQKTNPEKPISGAYFGTDDDVYEEFDWLKDHITDAGYNRYELSNFAKPGMSSIHNRVYRDFEAYLGIGIGAASLLLEPKVHRRTNTKDLNEYLKGNRIDKETAVNLTKKDILIEKFFLGLRTDIGLADITEFEDVLVKDYQKKLKEYQKLGLLEQYKNFVILTDEGMDVFNTIVTNLLEEI